MESVGGQQHHEGGTARPPGQIEYGEEAVGRNPEPVDRGPGRAALRSAVVGRGGREPRPVQAAPPVGAPLRVRLGPGTLLPHVFAVLGYLVPYGHVTIAAYRVGLRQVPHQDPHGPPVGRDVVRHQDQDGVLLVEPPENGAQVGNLIGPLGPRLDLAHECLRDLGPFLVRARAQRAFRQGDRSNREDTLVVPVLLPDDHGAQRLVALHHVVQRESQRGEVQWSAQTPAVNDVVPGPEGALFVASVEDADELLVTGQRNTVPFVPGFGR